MTSISFITVQYGSVTSVFSTYTLSFSLLSLLSTSPSRNALTSRIATIHVWLLCAGHLRIVCLRCAVLHFQSSGSLRVPVVKVPSPAWHTVGRSYGGPTGRRDQREMFGSLAACSWRELCKFLFFYFLPPGGWVVLYTVRSHYNVQPPRKPQGQPTLHCSLLHCGPEAAFFPHELMMSGSVTVTEADKHVFKHQANTGFEGVVLKLR